MTKKPKKLELYLIGDNRFAINRTTAAKMLNITSQMLIKYEKQKGLKPLPKDMKLSEKSIWYDLIYLLKWHSVNVKAQSSAMGGLSNGEMQVTTESAITADNAKEIESLESARLKREQRIKAEMDNHVTSGKWGSVDKLDKAMSAIGALMASSYQDTKETTPNSIITAVNEMLASHKIDPLDDLTVDYITSMLDDQFEVGMKQLQIAIGKKVKW